MACSCKVKKNVPVIDPLNKAQTVVSVQKAFLLQTEQKPQESLQPKLQKLDLSSTTKPDQLCFNCVRKHLGLAYMLTRDGGELRRLIAAGQLMCASNHIYQKYPNLSYKLLDHALLLLHLQNNIFGQHALQLLIQQFLYTPKEDIEQYIPRSTSVAQRDLLTLLLLYSLLFVQITYEQVNKTWATAHLSYIAYLRFRQSLAPETIRQYRALWKLIQSMQYYDENYLLARQLMEKLIMDKYRQVIMEFDVPQRKAQLQVQIQEVQRLYLEYKEERTENPPIISL